MLKAGDKVFWLVFGQRMPATVSYLATPNENEKFNHAVVVFDDENQEVLRSLNDLVLQEDMPDFVTEREIRSALEMDLASAELKALLSRILKDGYEPNKQVV